MNLSSRKRTSRFISAPFFNFVIKIDPISELKFRFHFSMCKILLVKVLDQSYVGHLHRRQET